MNDLPPPVAKPITKPTPKAAPATGMYAPRKPKPINPRIFFYTPEGYGKTTLAANTPNPLILMGRGENGYDTLLGAGRAPAVPAIDIPNWDTLMQTLEQFIANPGDRQTLVFDAVGSFERLCHEHVTVTHFGGDDGKFDAYGSGIKVALTTWMLLLQKIERVHEKGIMVLMLGHAKIKIFKDPSGGDYDRWIPDCQELFWNATARQFDAILFGNFQSVIRKEVATDKKGKGIGGADRMIYCDKRDSYVAKNRYGMPDSFKLSGNYETSWGELWAAITSNINRSEP